MPRLLPKGVPAFALHWDTGRSEPFDSWLGSWVYEVRTGHGLIHTHSENILHLLHLLREASIHPVNYDPIHPSLRSGEEQTVKVLQRHPNNGSMTSFRNWTSWAGEWQKLCHQKAGKAAAMLSQAGSPRAPGLTCSQYVPLTPSFKGVFLLRDPEPQENDLFRLSLFSLPSSESLCPKSTKSIRKMLPRGAILGVRWPSTLLIPSQARAHSISTSTRGDFIAMLSHWHQIQPYLLFSEGYQSPLLPERGQVKTISPIFAYFL